MYETSSSQSTTSRVQHDRRIQFGKTLNPRFSSDLFTLNKKGGENKMKKMLVILVALFMVGVASSAFACSCPGCTGACIYDNASQVVGMCVPQYLKLEVTGCPVLCLSCVDQSRGGGEVNDSSSRYTITTNLTNKKITGAISVGGNMPVNTYLKVALGAVAGSTSLGQQTLSTGAVDLVRNISHVSGSAPMTYTFGANMSADPGWISRTIKYVATAM
jgi:hypothetical protein